MLCAVLSVFFSSNINNANELNIDFFQKFHFVFGLVFSELINTNAYNRERLGLIGCRFRFNFAKQPEAQNLAVKQAF